ncbi:tubulin-specific chaperone A-like isoform X1 [Uloborus diversus]|uniref:tubulin-specific chaperone A-like isoform X1 n=1 Tax=Uloborus diversus TaxID=327109 RepID=UPI002409D15D|nr:tubulin-specific chaperone A-like isoform X1 [Uloborus diversus]
MATPALKQIKIKGGVVKRIAKEVSYYEKEILREKQRLEKMKKDGKDEYALKHQEEVIRESARMVPHCTNELRIAYNELKNLLVVAMLLLFYCCMMKEKEQQPKKKKKERKKRKKKRKKNKEIV